jgi:hypothetical protein
MGVGELKKACPPLDGRFFQVPRRDLSGGMLGLLPQDTGKIARFGRLFCLVGWFHQAQPFVLDDKP